MDIKHGLPRPSPDQVFYKANLEEGFRAHPEKKENFLKFEAAQRGTVVDYLPVKLDIENVSRCNFHCKMCEVSDWPGLKRAEDMSFEDFKALIDSQYGLMEIKLQGLGEPLMGECYFEMIKYARSKHIWVRSTTNASLLHLNDNYKSLIDTDICELQVSIDGATEGTYEAIRRGGKYNRMVENCKMLNQYADEVNRKRTRMWVVVQKDNFDELERFPAFAKELGFHRLTFSIDLNDFGLEKWREVNKDIGIQEKFNPAIGERLVALGEEKGVEVTFWSIGEKYDTTQPKKLCPWPFERAYISSDMRIVPCCMVANPEVVELGDAHKLETEWNGERMTAFRQAHLDGDLPEVCRSCYVNRAKEG